MSTVPVEYGPSSYFSRWQMPNLFVTTFSMVLGEAGDTKRSLYFFLTAR